MKFHLPENDDLKEIVFENRNKSYGAYRLRSDYHRTLNRSMGISLLAISLFAGLMMIVFKLTHKPFVPGVTRNETYVVRTIELETRAKGEIKTEVLPPARREKAPAVLKPLEQNFAVTAKPVEPITTTATPAVPSSGQEGNSLASATPGTTPAGLSAEPGNPGLAAPLEMAAVDVAPAFPGGMEKFYKYLHDKLVFTAAAREARLSTRMYVNFVLGKDGKISSIRILRKAGYGMDEVVESVLAKSPEWSPGMVRGQPVSTVIRLPISFESLQ